MGLVARNAAALLSGVAVLVLAGSGAGYAQTATTTAAVKKNAGNVTLLERLVIGAGAPKVAIDTPQAVTVLNQADIDNVQATTTGDLFSAIPSVTMVGSDRAFGEAFNIRGVGQTDNSSDGSRIIVNVDGAPKFNEQYRMGSFFSEAELYKRIEVLRGPASSTLYGSGALGGVVNFQTKDASDFIKDGYNGAARIKASYASNGNGTLISGLVAQRINETFDILATGNWRRSDAFTLAGGGTLSGSDFASLSGLVKGTARFGNNDEQVVRLSYQHWNSNADQQDYAQTGTQTAFGKVDRDVTDRTAVLSYENPASDNPWVDLKASLSFSDIAVKQTNPTLPGQSFMDADYGYRTWTGNLSNTFDYTGADFENYLTIGVHASTQDRIAESRIGAGAITTHPEGTERKLGIYAQNEFIWNDSLTLIPGVRVDFHNMSPSSAVAGAREIDGTAYSPKLAALYKFNENFGVFGSVAHTQRFPTLDELYSTQAFSAGGARGPTPARSTSLNLEKEYSTNYEGGFTASAYDIGSLGGTASLKTTVFRNELTNLITSRPSTAASGLSYFYNVNNARISGVEVEASYESDWVFGRLAYAYTKGENIDTGAPLTTIPQNRLTLTLGGRDLEHAIEYGARVTLASNADYVAAGTGTSAAYQTLDLFASWKPQEGAFAGTEAQFSVDNVFDTDYRENLSTDRSKGRTFKLTLAKQFDY